MRKFGHWSPHYLFHRLLEKHYRRQNPHLPWLTQAANRMLDTYLLPGDRGLEYGSGRSTLWFARRVAALTSVEHNPVWHQRVAGMLAEAGLTNVVYCLHEKAAEQAEWQALPAYVRAADRLEDGSLDFVLVDGIYRDACALVGLLKLKPGGVLILDNANLFLPCDSHAPNSLGMGDEPSSPLWRQFWGQVNTWRRLWTSNGVSDTAFFFKPQQED